MRVVDASVLVSAVADDEASGIVAREAIAYGPLAAPEIIDLEVVAGIRRLRRAELLSDERCSSALVALATAPVDRWTHATLISRIWDLRHNVSPYDASYIALSEALGGTLVTADRRLASAPGIRCEVELVG